MTIRQSGQISEEFSWPPWVDMVTVASHLTLTISSSLSFYIYFLLYGAKHKVHKMYKVLSGKLIFPL